MSSSPSCNVEPPPDALRPGLRERIRARDDYRSWVLGTCLCGMFASSFTFTILGVSLKPIADDLGSSVATIAWVLTGPMLAQALALPVLGKMGDLYGHRRVYLIGFGCAAVASALTAIAWNAASLIGFRALGQLAGTATMPASMALIFRVYAPWERVKAMGKVSLITAGSPVLGLAIGGVLIDAIGWRPIFAIQAVLSLAAIVIALIVLEETPRRHADGLDWPGAATLALAAFGLTFGVNRVPVWGVADLRIWAALGIVPIALVAFVRCERRARHPLLPLEFFRRRQFSLPLVVSFALQFGYMGGFVITPLLLMDHFGLAAAATSAVVMSRPIAFSATSPLAGNLGARLGERPMIVVGAGAVFFALVVMGGAAAWMSVPALVAGLVLAGIGLGASQPSMSAVVANSVDESNHGIAASAQSMASSVGMVIGVSVLTALSATATGPLDYRNGYGIGAAGALVGVVAALALSPRAATSSSTEA